MIKCSSSVFLKDSMDTFITLRSQYLTMFLPLIHCKSLGVIAHNFLFTILPLFFPSQKLIEREVDSCSVPSHNPFTLYPMQSTYAVSLYQKSSY